MQKADLPDDMPDGNDPFVRQLMEQENAMLNPDEWGVYLPPIIQSQLDPPQDPDAMTDQSSLFQALYRRMDLRNAYPELLRQIRIGQCRPALRS